MQRMRFAWLNCVNEETKKRPSSLFLLSFRPRLLTSRGDERFPVGHEHQRIHPRRVWWWPQAPPPWPPTVTLSLRSQSHSRLGTPIPGPVEGVNRANVRADYGSYSNLTRSRFQKDLVQFLYRQDCAQRENVLKQVEKTTQLKREQVYGRIRKEDTVDIDRRPPPPRWPTSASG